MVFCCVFGGIQSCCLTREKPLFCIFLMKLRSYSKAQCPPRHKHHWTTSQQVGHRQQKWHAILALLATSTVNSMELCSSSGCHDLHVLPAHGHWCLQLCKSWLHLGLLQGVQGAVLSGLWHPIWAELTGQSFPCQGCEWYLSSCFQEARRNLAFSAISIPLVILAEIGGEQHEQTDRHGNCDFICLAS